MSGIRDRLGLGGVALLAVGCCAGIPLLLAAGLSVAAFAVIGGGAIAALALLLALGFIVARRST